MAARSRRSTTADAMRRLVDIVAALVIGLVTLPIWFVAALAVRGSLGPPVLFRQLRLGRNGDPFTLYKLRSMRPPRPGEDGPEHDHRRLGRLGRWLRSTSIDELPSLWNLLRGEITLVGPRPLPVSYWERFTDEQRRRFEVKPGITGWAQVCGRNSLGWPQRLALDVEYVERRSLHLDVSILLRTVAVVLARRGVDHSAGVTMVELPPAGGDACNTVGVHWKHYLSPPEMSPVERDLLLQAFDSGWIAPAGPDLDAFEHELTQLSGVAEVVGLSSGTAALHLALELVGVGAGDDVLMSDLTFAASAFAAEYLGARPCFVDSEPSTWQIDAELLAEELSARAARGRLPRAVVAVDLYGSVVDGNRIAALCDHHGVALVEDAAEAVGAQRDGRAAGTFGRVGVYSFNGNKIVTTGGGGALLTDDRELARRARYLSTQAREPVAHYEHREIGRNYRMGNVNAAIGRGQLRTLAARIAERRRVHESYRRAFGGVDGVQFQQVPSGCEPNYWLTTVEIDNEVFGASAADVLAALRGAAVEARPGFMPMHLQPVFADHPVAGGAVAAAHFARSVSLPSSGRLTGGEVAAIVEVVLAARR